MLQAEIVPYCLQKPLDMFLIVAYNDLIKKHLWIIRSDNMTDRYYTVDEIAEMIKIHPKTVQRYIREGRLRATKVGKSWRVSGHDLSTFTEGGSVADTAPLMMDESFERAEIKISAVIDIPVANTQESVRIANTLTAISNSKPPEYGSSAMQTQYLLSEKVIRVMVWGSLGFTQIILDSIGNLTGNQEG